ncbi:hypothetical protein [Breznakia pachnodae]|uniref:Uncharacterized protein n=1 Tax=Breznakia pachnodae TaxID=265178 RepID=A0ABU0E5A6_9FIRM|nr:hypothetical protein [Breznakia pachnodae]MDQ0362082.1 hypothetical protein [Breznakia pachnodae]
MNFDITCEQQDIESPLQTTKEVEEAIQSLSTDENYSDILIEVEPAFDNIIVLMVDYVRKEEGGLFKKKKVTDMYYRVHAVVNMHEEEDFINYYYKASSYEEVRNIVLDFIEGKRTPSVHNWTTDKRLY